MRGPTAPVPCTFLLPALSYRSIVLRVSRFSSLLSLLISSCVLEYFVPDLPRRLAVLLLLLLVAGAHRDRALLGLLLILSATALCLRTVVLGAVITTTLFRPAIVTAVAIALVLAALVAIIVAEFDVVAVLILVIDDSCFGILDLLGFLLFLFLLLPFFEV